jgi:serine/threonine protein kinase
MPVRLIRDAGVGAHVPLLDGPTTIGRDETSTIVLTDPRVGSRHARLRYRKGQWLLSAEDEQVLYVGTERVPMLPLSDGDVLGFGVDAPDDPSRQLLFRDRMQGAFVATGESWIEAWANHPASSDPANGPERYGEGESLTTRDSAQVEHVRREGAPDLVVKRLGPVANTETAERFLRVIARLAGAPHPALAALHDGGVVRVGDALHRFMVTEFVRGQTAKVLVDIGGLDAAAVLPVLLGLSAGVGHLHHRGLLHRDVSPGNVLVRPDGTGALIDFDQVLPEEDAGRASLGVVGTPGYLAPEAVVAGGPAVGPPADVFGIGAVGYALLCGHAPAEGDDLLDTLGAAFQMPPRPGELGLEVPPAMESLLFRALAPDPKDRPTASGFHRQLAFAAAQMGLGEGV